MAQRIGVGFDRSPTAAAALTWAAEEATLRGTQLEAVHAVYWDKIGYEMLTPTEEQLIEWGHRLVAKELDEAGVAGGPVVVHGHAAQVLERDSADADLLVLGQRERGAVAGPWLGSVSEHCVRRAKCPVMVTKAVGGAQRNLATHAQVKVSDTT